MLPLTGSAQTIGGRVTEMDTSTPPSDGSIGANRRVDRGIRVGRLERPIAGWESHSLEIAVFSRHTVF